jgi:hypothetical protein
MGNYWSVHLPDILADNGTIAAYSPRGLRLAEYWTEIVAQASNLPGQHWARDLRAAGFLGRSGRLGVEPGSEPTADRI